MSDTLSSEAAGTELLLTVSHELRAPLTVIKASVKLIAEGMLGEVAAEQKELLKATLNNIERMIRIVNQLLEVNKSEAGRLDLHAQRVEWTMLLKDIAKSFEPLAAERGLSIELDMPHTRMEGFVDRDKIVQVLTNLVHNAVKFTPTGQITLGAREESDVVTLWVADTGPGFQKKDLPEVFGQFKRFQTPSRPEDDGAGLGLALCRRLILLHGGSIRVENMPQGGACFLITLPRMSPEEIFRREALRLMKKADETAKALSIAEIRIQNWRDLRAALGRDASNTLLNYFEAQLKASLRDDSDFVIQRGGALWIAVFSTSLPEAKSVLLRLEQKVQDASLANLTQIPLVLKVHLVSYPQDSQNPDDILNLLSGRRPF